MLDLVTLPMTIPELRVDGAPILLSRQDGVRSALYLTDDHRPGWCIVWFDFGTMEVPLTSCALNLHHPNGERIARAFHGRAPTTPIEDLAYLRDGVLATVAMVSE